jgi:hypothetical protein
MANKAMAGVGDQVVETVHPLKKSYTFISTKHVDYENLTAFEAVTMSLALFLGVFAALIPVTPVGLS